MADTNAAASQSAGQSDPGMQAVARVYARALVGALEKDGQAENVLAELASFVSDVLDAFPRFETVLTTGLVSPEEKIAMLERVASRRTSPLLLNFLKVLARHGRLNAIRAVSRTAAMLFDESRGRYRVEVATAAPLDGGQVARIQQKLRNMLGGDPNLVQSVNPALVGGVVLRVGDTIYDGSVATRLDRVRAQMIQRTVHEIQRRRDRFGNPAGN